MDLAYVAHSDSCALLLDSDGVCRWIIPKADERRHARELATARRCVGAQFVATLDRDAEGLLGHEPRVGKTLLFASPTNGRIALVRFGPLTAFETVDDRARDHEREAAPRPSADAGAPTRRAEPPTVVAPLVAPAVLEAAISESPAPATEIAPPTKADAPATKADAPATKADAPPTKADAPPAAEPPPAAKAPETASTQTAAVEDDAPPPASTVTTTTTTRSDESEIELHTGSFSALASPAIASFLKDVVALAADTPYSRALDMSDIEDLHTGSFGSLSAPMAQPPGDRVARASLPPPPLPAPERREGAMTAMSPESESAIATGNYGRLTDGVSGPQSLGNLADLIEAVERQDEATSWRPSGFIRRAWTSDNAGAPAPVADDSGSEDETLRFARVGGSISRR